MVHYCRPEERENYALRLAVTPEVNWFCGREEDRGTIWQRPGKDGRGRDLFPAFLSHILLCVN